MERSDPHKTLIDVMSKIREANHSEEVQASMASLKAEFENLDFTTGMVLQRIKSPLSTLRKFNAEPDKYGIDYLRTKDMLGLMVIVDKNSDVDKTIEYIKENYGMYKNPHSRSIVHDYRIEPTRDYQDANQEGEIVFDKPTDKGYQMCDGYKNVRANIVLDGYPIEIQIKTREQYISHQVTHDKIYKSPLLKDKNDRIKLVSKLFPYFEALAHRTFHYKDMTENEKFDVDQDLQKIYTRNKDVFNENPEVFNDACIGFAVHSFILNNFHKLSTQQTLTSSVINTKLLEAEIERALNYKNDVNHRLRPSLTAERCFMNTVLEVANMNYKQFRDLMGEIDGSYLLDGCVVSGSWDLIRGKDVKLINKLGESFRNVVVGVYEDDLSKLIIGDAPMFSQKERISTVESMKGVYATVPIDIKGGGYHYDVKESISPVPVIIEREKPYDIAYVPGVFDMLHPGHVDYIRRISEFSEVVIVGQKSDDYVRNVKHKESVLKGEERREVLDSLRCVDEVVETETDILPPEHILRFLQQKVDAGGASAIFLGSDWMTKPESKSEESLKELEYLKTEYPGITLTSIGRGQLNVSSSLYRQQGMEKLGDDNPYELTIVGEINEQF